MGESQKDGDSGYESATVEIDRHSMSPGGPGAEPERDVVVVEEAVTIVVAEGGSYTLMCTPTDLEYLAAGFLFSEGIVDCREDIFSIKTGDAKPAVVGVRGRRAPLQGLVDVDRGVIRLVAE